MKLSQHRPLYLLKYPVSNKPVFSPGEVEVIQILMSFESSACQMILKSQLLIWIFEINSSFLSRSWLRNIFLKMNIRSVEGIIKRKTLLKPTNLWITMIAYFLIGQIIYNRRPNSDIITRKHYCHELDWSSTALT